MAQHTQLRIETGLQIFFCDPHEAYDNIAEYIDFYNMRRLHSANGFKAPIDHDRLDKPEVAA